LAPQDCGEAFFATADSDVYILTWACHPLATAHADRP
jgi:hypothetical protein